MNYYYMRNVADGRFLSPEDLREQWRASLGEVPADRVVCYCGSGVTACHDVLALEHAGRSALGVAATLAYLWATA